MATPSRCERIETRHRFGILARGIEQRDARENVALRIGQRDEVRGQTMSPHTPQRLAADMIHPLDARQIPLTDTLRAEQVEAPRRAAAILVACERERSPLAGQPDDLALAASRDVETGRSVVVQGSRECSRKESGAL